MICEKYGKMESDGHKSLRNTVDCLRPNSYNLRLNLDYNKKFLEMEEDCVSDNSGKSSSNNFKKVDDVAIWILESLHASLLKKHKETFWIEVESRKKNGHEEFKLKKIEHTRNPVISQFEILLEQGLIIVDLMLGRTSKKVEKSKRRGDAVSFKIKNKASSLLFPESKTYIFK